MIRYPFTAKPAYLLLLLSYQSRLIVPAIKIKGNVMKITDFLSLNSLLGRIFKSKNTLERAILMTVIFIL